MSLKLPFKTRFVYCDVDEKIIWYHVDEIDEDNSLELIRILNFLDNANYNNENEGQKELPITLRINCCGGNYDETLAIIDNIRNCKTVIDTIVEGKALSGAALIASCPTNGTRKIFKNSSYMLHGLKISLPFYSLSEANFDLKFLNVKEKEYANLIHQFSRSRISKKDALEKFAKAESMFITPKETVTYKLMDKVIGL